MPLWPLLLLLRCRNVNHDCAAAAREKPLFAGLQSIIR
jgi:hypothetical protein